MMTFDMKGYWLILRVARYVGVIVCLNELGVCIFGMLPDLEIQHTLSEVVIWSSHGSGMSMFWQGRA